MNVKNGQFRYWPGMYYLEQTDTLYELLYNGDVMSWDMDSNSIRIHYRFYGAFTLLVAPNAHYLGPV
jgi:hypothetical protein